MVAEPYVVQSTDVPVKTPALARLTAEEFTAFSVG
jgi:hypothetical protein